MRRFHTDSSASVVGKDQDMRKAKMFKTQRKEAAAAWQRGKRREAHELWAKADEGRRAFQESKRNRKGAGQ